MGVIARVDIEGLAKMDNKKLDTNIEIEGKDLVIHLYDEIFHPRFPVPRPLNLKHAKAKQVEVRGCKGEERAHKCFVRQFFEYEREDSPTLGEFEKPRIVQHERSDSGIVEGVFVAQAISMVRPKVRYVQIWRWDGVDDVWIQIAREEGFR